MKPRRVLCDLLSHSLRARDGRLQRREEALVVRHGRAEYQNERLPAIVADLVGLKAFVHHVARRRGCGMAPGGARAAKVIKEANIYVRTCGHRRTYVGYSLTRKSEVGFRGQTGNHHGEGGAERAIADPRSL
jgi:hypothetical protein